MKYSDEKQILRAENDFKDAMSDYFSALEEIATIRPTAEQFNTLTRQVDKLTKTLRRIKDENNSKAWQMDAM